MGRSDAPDSRMSHQIRIGVQFAQKRKGAFWVRLQEDERHTVSIGFISTTFVLRGFTSTRELDGHTVSEYVDLEASHSVRARTTPHFSFEGEYFHVIGNSGAPLFEALCWREPAPGTDRSPLLRIVSKPFFELAGGRTITTRDTLLEIGLPLPGPNYRAALTFDVVSRRGVTGVAREGSDLLVGWHGLALCVRGFAVTGQDEGLITYF